MSSKGLGSKERKVERAHKLANEWMKKKITYLEEDLEKVFAGENTKINTIQKTELVKIFAKYSALAYAVAYLEGHERRFLYRANGGVYE